MTYDTSGPVRVNEFKSLLLLLLAIVIAGGGLWWSVKHYAKPTSAAEEWNAHAYVPPERHPRSRFRRPPASRPADKVPTYVFRDPDDRSQALVKGHDTFVTISILNVANSVNYRVNRTYPRGGPEDQALAELWETARAVTRMVRDPAFADNYYNATQEQLDQLNALAIRLPHLNGPQQKKITDLYKATEGKKGDDLAKADQALEQAVAAMPIPPEELKALRDSANAARELLRPDQLDLIDSSVDRRGSRVR